MPKNAVYAERINDAILRMQHSGLIQKLYNELQWDVEKQRGSSPGTLLKATSANKFQATDVEDRGLTLADTEGMFLLMGIGYLFGASVLMSEVIGGCANKCRQFARRASKVSMESFLPNSSSKTSISVKDDRIRDNNMTAPVNSVNSTAVVRMRRKSDQMDIPSETPVRTNLNMHRRHNSLITGLVSTDRLNDYGILKRSAFVKFDEENQLEFNGNSKRNYHTVEINRVPTPYCIEETFGEKVYH